MAVVSDIEIRLRADIARLQQDMNAARRSVDGAMGGITEAANRAKVALGSIAAGIGLGQLSRLTDEYAKFTAQLKLASNSQREYSAAYADVKRIAADSMQGLQQTGVLYARIANGTRELGATQKQVAAITETVNLALMVSGATAEEAASAQLQLSQAFSAGALRGEEFNAVNEAAPRLMLALADGIGVPVGALKKMAEEGKITSQIMADTLPNALVRLREEAKQVQTIAGGFTVLKNNIMEFVGQQAQANGIVMLTTTALRALGENLTLVAGAVLTLTAVKIGTWLAGMAKETVSAITANRALAASNLATAQAASTAATAEAALTAARLAEVRAAAVAAAGQVQLAVAINGVIPAQTRAAAAEAARVSALGALAVAQRAASTSATVLSGALAVLGGPLGAVITVVGLAVTAWSVWGDKVKSESDKAAAAVDESTVEMISRLDKQIEKLKERNRLQSEEPRVRSIRDLSDADASGLARAKKAMDDATNGTGDFRNRSVMERQLALTELTYQYETALLRVTQAQDEASSAAGRTRDSKLADWYAQNGNNAQKLSAELEKLRKEFGTIPPEMEKLVRAKYADKGAEKAIKAEAEAYRNLTSSIRERVADSAREVAGLKPLNEAQKMAADIAEQVAAGKLKLSKVERENVRNLLDTFDANLKSIESQKAYKSMVDDLANSEKKLADARAATIAKSQDEAAANEEALATFGMTKTQIEALTLARMEDQLAQRSSLGLTLDEITQLEALIEAKKRSVGSLTKVDELEAAKQAGEEFDKLLDSSKAQEFGDTLAKAFGRAGSAMGQLSSTFQAYAEKQMTFGKAREALEKKHSVGQRDQKAYLADLSKLEKARFNEQLGGYGDMAGAAAGFFDEQSKGYKIVSGISQAFHAAELAATMAELVPKAISAVLTQGQGDPYTALPRMAAMAAFVAALGVAIGGGGGGGGGGMSVSASRQKANGTGSVLGDSDAKSESLAKALEMVEDNTYRNLAVNYDMLSALRNIESSLSGLGNLIVRSSGISGELGEDIASGAERSFNKIFGTGSLGEKLTGGLTGKIIGSIFGGKITSLDTGLTANAASIASIMAGGLSASQYNDTKKSGGWFGKDKYRTETRMLDAQVNDQFTKVILSMAQGVKSAGAVLGLTGDDFTSRLNSFVVDLGKISLTGLKGDEIQEALEAAFSKMGDDLASFAVSGLSEFQKVGEGTYETLVRIANNYATVDAVLDSFGKSFGAVGLASVAARENLIDLAGGLDEFTAQGSFFLENFFSDAEKEATLRTAVYERLDKITGGSAVSTVKQFQQLVLAQDLTTAAGREAYSSLMSVSQAFIDLSKFTEEAATKTKELAEQRRSLEIQIMEMSGNAIGALAARRHDELAATDESLRALYERIYALEDEAALVQSLRDAASSAFNVLQKSISAQKVTLKAEFDKVMEGFGESIKAQQAKIAKLQSLSQALSGARVGDASDLQASVNRSMAQGQLAAALALARSTGYLPDADTLKDALSAVSSDAADQFATFVDYQRDQALTQNTIEELSGLTSSQLSTAERSLAALERQKEIAQASYDAQVSRLDGLLTSAQLQLDAINGVNLTTMSVVAAFSSFQATISAALKNSTIASGPSAGSATIEGLYQSVFGRNSDAGGLAYWSNMLKGGMSADAIRDAFYSSEEYQSRSAHVYNGQSAGSGQSAMLGELQAMNARLANVESATQVSASSNSRMASEFSNVTQGGNVLRTEPA